jgi:beta-catenin-like protein 1
VLCGALLLPDNRALFAAAEGVELMLLILKSKRLPRLGAVKALDYATFKCTPACEHFVGACCL